MKIQYASDLHLEFHENSRWLKENPLIAVGDILILAGDIGYLGDDNYGHHPFWDWCAESFRQTIVIPGNHELTKALTSTTFTKAGNSIFGPMSRCAITV